MLQQNRSSHVQWSDPLGDRRHQLTEVHRHRRTDRGANLFPPIPSVLILPLVGFLTSRGQLAFTAVVVATAGSVIGALIFYALSLPLAWRVCAGSLRGIADGHF
jgi:hypothetical protein